MNIGEAAKASGVNAKLIRHYESIGIIPKVARSESGYRKYTEADIHILSFCEKSPRTGFFDERNKKAGRVVAEPFSRQRRGKSFGDGPH